MRNYALLETALLEDLGVVKGCSLYSDTSLDTARRYWMANSFMKKFIDITSPNADLECLKLFKQSNERCSTFAFNPLTSFEEQVIGEVKNLFDSYFFSGPDLNFSFSDIMEGQNVGPGASLDVDSFNFYTKLFDSNLSCTSDLLFRIYRSTIRNDSRWFCAELSRSLHHEVRVVEGNRLSFVPKTTEISRSICTEPNLNMFFQKGIGAFLERILRDRFKINLSYQPTLNRKLAREGSLYGTFGTLDLSSASDSMSVRLLRDIIPPEFYWWLDVCRSPRVTYPDGTKEDLHMVSSMGNAFTFPLQTLLFSSIVVACYRVLGIKPKYDMRGPKNFAVFGDDIIVVKDAYQFVTRCLELFGFVVNVSKSFNTGDFRESCGSDFFRGHDIRGVYLKSLRTGADVYSAINRVIRWSARTGIFLPNTVEVLRGYLGRNVLCIPLKDGDSEGLKTPYPCGPSVGIDSKTQSVFYHALVSKSLSFRLPDDPTRTLYYPSKGKRRRKILFNPDGEIVAFLAGFIRDERIIIRKDVNRFKVRRRTTSSWSGVVIPPDSNLLYIEPLKFFEQLANNRCAYAAGLDDQEREWIIAFSQYLSILR